MSIKRYNTGDSNRYIYEYPGVIPELDLTSDPWNLQDGQASVVMGVDPRFRGRLRSLHPRRKANISTPSSVTLTNAETSNFHSSTGSRISANIDVAAVGATVCATYDDTGGATGNYEVTLSASRNFVEGDILWAFNGSSNLVGWATIETKTSGTVLNLDKSLGGDDSWNVFIYRCFHDYFYVIDDSGTIDPSKLVYKNGSWPSDVTNGFIVKNGDGREGDAEIGRIASVSTTTENDDTINWSLDFSTTWARDDKFYVIYSQEVDRSGAWLSTGRYFYIAQGSLAAEFLNLGS